LLPFARPEKAPLLTALVCTAALAGSTSLLAVLMGPAVASALRGSAPPADGVLAWLGVGGPGSDLRRLCVAIIGVAALKSAAQFGQGFLLQTSALRITARLRRAVYERLLALPQAFFQDKHSGELFTRFTTDAAQVELALTQTLASYLKDSLTIVSMLFTCLVLDWRLTLFLIGAGPVAGIVISSFARRLKRISRASQGALGLTTERLSEVIAQIRVVQSFRQESNELARFDVAQGRYLAEMRRSFFSRAAFTPVLETLGVMGLCAAILAAGRAMAAGLLSPDHLFTFFAAAMLLYQPVKALSSSGQLTASALASAERLMEILDAPDEDERRALPPLPPFSHQIRFEGVSFAYGPATPTSGEPILEDFNLTLARGERVALVGPSGAGKSTVAGLLLGLWNPQKGALTQDGAELARFSLSSWRAQLALVTQEPILFSGTIAQNIAMAREGATAQEITAAAEAAGVTDFSNSLAAGLDSEVGERGCKLSGGQRQRVAIARALVRKAPILVLDEATSSLDSATELAVDQSIQKLLEGRTALVIAHRLSTIRSADRILVMEKGKIVEEGTHDALVAASGPYARLWRSFVIEDPAPGASAA
jgi:subfamily B ATP-binding cassette protein MsbA